jgi:hypothetical protein
MLLCVATGYRASLKNWQLWQNGITQNHVYDDKKPLVREFIKGMAIGPITGLSTLPDYGTQIKLVFKYKDGSQALYKPMRYGDYFRHSTNQGGMVTISGTLQTNEVW